MEAKNRAVANINYSKKKYSLRNIDVSEKYRLLMHTTSFRLQENNFIARSLMIRWLYSYALLFIYISSMVGKLLLFLFKIFFKFQDLFQWLFTNICCHKLFKLHNFIIKMHLNFDEKYYVSITFHIYIQTEYWQSLWNI